MVQSADAEVDGAQKFYLTQLLKEQNIE